MKKLVLFVLTVALALPSFAGGNPAPAAGPKEFTVKVTGGEYLPASITVPKGQAVRIKFLRVADPSCGSEVVVPSLKLKKALPLNKPVYVDLPAQKAGTKIAFTCGMDMMKGSIVVQ